MATLQLLKHHTVYRNEHPQRISEYVAFPLLVALPDDTLLCMCRHGTARESVDGEPKIHRSRDGGRTWSLLPTLAIPAGEEGNVLSPGGLASTSEGDLLAWLKARPHMGDQPRSYVFRSQDQGDHWSPAEQVEFKPFNGTATVGEVSSLSDGTLIGTGETGGDGVRIGKDHWVTLVSGSQDGGRTWDEVRAVHQSVNPHYYDLCITQLADGRWLAAYWTHDMKLNQGVNVHMALSSDGGRIWSEPHDAGFWGQRTDICTLQSGRVLAVTNHRRSPLGIRALLSADDGTTFDEAQHIEIWGVDPARIRSAPTAASRQDVVENVLDSYHHFTFGTPASAQLSDGTIVVAFYVTEESVTYVRCCRMVERE